MQQNKSFDLNSEYLMKLKKNYKHKIKADKSIQFHLKKNKNRKERRLYNTMDESMTSSIIDAGRFRKVLKQSGTNNANGRKNKQFRRQLSANSRCEETKSSNEKEDYEGFKNIQKELQKRENKNEFHLQNYSPIKQLILNKVRGY